MLDDLKKLKREDEVSFIESLMKLIKLLGSDNNNDQSDKQACILYITAIINLYDVNIRMSKMHQTNLFIILRNLLLSTDPMVVQMASKALGKLESTGVDCDVEFKKGVENMIVSARQSAGILCVRELILAVPSKLFVNLPVFLENIMVALTTSKNVTVRLDASELFRLALSLSASQPKLDSKVEASNEFYKCIENSLNDLELCLKSNEMSDSRNGIIIDAYLDTSLNTTKTDDVRIHGHLLILLEILKFSSLEFETFIDNVSKDYSNDKWSTNDGDDEAAVDSLISYHDLHIKYLLKTRPYSFEPLNDLFEFLFEKNKIKIKK